MTPTIGHKIIDAITSGSLLQAKAAFDADGNELPVDRTLYVWSANAAEQLTALVEAEHRPGDIQQRMQAALDRRILEALEDGIPTTDENGREIRVPPTAAFITAAIRWVKDREDRHREHNPVLVALENLKRAQRVGGTIPPVDDEADDIATR